MDVKVVKNQIATNSLQSFYIFSGSEWKVQQLYIEQIEKVSHKQRRYINSIADIFSNLGNMSFIQKSYVYVVRDDKDIMTDEKLQNNLQSMLGDNILILLLTTVDKRTKFYKQFKDSICEFEQLKPQILKKYIRQAIDISDVNCDRLMEVCEYDYGRCLLEIDKVIHWADGYAKDKQERISDEGAVIRLLNDGIIYRPPQDAIFDFVDAVLHRKIKLAFNLLYQSYAVGEAVLVLLSVLYNNTKQVLQVQTCTSNDVVKSTGLTAWQVKCATEKQGYYSNEELEYMLRLIHKCETGIKSGKMEDSIAVEYILVHIM